MVRWTVWVAIVAASATCACLSLQSSAGPPSTTPQTIDIDAVRVPLNPQNPRQDAIGDFAYAGGLELTSRATDRLHGLSDLEVLGDRMVAVSDDGDLLEARLTFDASQRLAGVADATIRPLVGEDGRPLTEKADADAEGLAILPNGDRLVSFERRHRILLYPSGSALPRRVPAPDQRFPENEGLEALSVDPEAGSDAYVAGAEASGDTWRCRMSSPCTAGPTVTKEREFGLVSMKRMRGLDTAYLLRAFDAARGNRISLQVFRSGKPIARLDLARPLTVDNYEGVAAVPRDGDVMRFYLLSDDNASRSQRTLLLAFDWRAGHS